MVSLSGRSNLAGRYLYSTYFIFFNTHPYRLNMELDPKVYLGSCVQLYSLASQLLSLYLGSYTWGLLVIQDRRHLCVTPCSPLSYRLSHIGISTLLAYPTPSPPTRKCRSGDFPRTRVSYSRQFTSDSSSVHAT